MTASELHRHTVIEGKLGPYVARVMRGTPDFPGRLPNVVATAKRPGDHARYFAKKTADSKLKYQRNLVDVKEAMLIYEAKFNRYYSALEPLLTDYDKEEIVPNTCAMGIWKTASTDFDNKGYLGVDVNVTYPRDIEESIVAWYKKHDPNVDQGALRLSFVRGKFAGWPFMIGGMNRSLSSLFLGTLAALTLNSRANYKQDRLRQLYEELYNYHGAPFTLEGSRTQHTGKEIAMVLTEGVHSSLMFNPRYRIINMESKLSTMDIRMQIKKMLTIIQNHPLHTQDRSEIKKRIASAQAAGKVLVAIDQSKFDFRHGGLRGEQQIKMHGAILKDEEYVRSAILTFKQRLITYHYGGLYEMPGDSLLKSGMGNTTLVGCTGNATGVVAALSYGLGIPAKDVISKFGQGPGQWDALMWGDDCVGMFPDQTWVDALYKGMKKWKLEADTEPTIKYLGNNYAQGDFKGSVDMGYSLGRAFQQQVFPEREKMYPFNLIGYIARLDLMGEKGKDFHSRMSELVVEDMKCDNFAFSDRHGVLEKLLPEVEKHADKISQLDDTLTLLTHGVHMEDFGDDNDLPDIYKRMLGVTITADVTDPAKFLSDELSLDEKLSKNDVSRIIKTVASIANGDMTSYRDLLNLVGYSFKLEWPQGSVVY